MKAQPKVGHIKIDRKILEWEWYSDINTCRLFIHLLIKANWKDGRFLGVEVPRGSLATSYRSLSDETGLTEKQVRVVLEKLKKTGEVAVKRHPKFSVITVQNYCMYQDAGQSEGSQVALKGQSSGSQRAEEWQSEDTQRADEGQTEGSRVATIEEKKEDKKERNKTYTCAFERIWALYPRKKEKAKAYHAYHARLGDGFSEDDLERSVKYYAEECERNDTQERYIKLPATFFGPNTPFLDYLKKDSVLLPDNPVLEDEEEVGDDW